MVGDGNGEIDAMKLIEFPEQNVVIAEDQKEYLPMPAYKLPGHPQGYTVCCWDLTVAEIEEVARTGIIWQTILTFNNPMHPQLLSVEKPEMPQI